jgi:hypothetical protein
VTDTYFSIQPALSWHNRLALVQHSGLSVKCLRVATDNKAGQQTLNQLLYSIKGVDPVYKINVVSKKTSIFIFAYDDEEKEKIVKKYGSEVFGVEKIKT